MLSKWVAHIQGACSSGISSATLTPIASNFQTYSSLRQKIANTITPMTMFVIVNTIHDYMTM
jgi:hypothetical protein